MKRKLKVIILMLSVMLLMMPNCIDAKYIISYENTPIEVKIDNRAPVIEGVEENKRYNRNVQVRYYDNTEIRSAIYYYNSEIKEFNVKAKEFESGHLFCEEGYYKIVVTDIYGNETQISNFLVDKTAPQIKGVEKGFIYDLPPKIEYYDKYGIEKIEIKTEEELKIEYQYKNSNRKPNSDRTSSTISLDVFYSPKEVREYRWYIKKEADFEYQLIDTNLENQFTFIDLQPETKYNIYCMAITQSGKAYMSNLVTAQTLPEIQKVEIIEVLDTSYKIKVTNIPSKYQYIYFPTWTDRNGQDDLIWYRYEVNDKQCIFTLDYNNHNKEVGMYHTNIYLEENKEVVYIQSTDIWLDQEEPEKEKPELVGKVEITVTDTAGNTTNTDYFIDEIITIQLYKTYGKSSYLKLKEILQNKMESFDDDNYIIRVKQSELDKIKSLEITDYIDEVDGYFWGIKYFRKLEKLTISKSTKVNPDDLSTLTNLKYLEISNCQSDYAYDLTFLNQLPNLECLNTMGTKVVNEEVIQNLTNLKEWKN